MNNETSNNSLQNQTSCCSDSTCCPSEASTYQRTTKKLDAMIHALVIAVINLKNVVGKIASFSIFTIRVQIVKTVVVFFSLDTTRNIGKL